MADQENNIQTNRRGRCPHRPEIQQFLPFFGLMWASAPTRFVHFAIAVSFCNSSISFGWVV